jgi:hypothetical protein
MKRPLNLDRTRCYGIGCELKKSCQRQLTLPLDDEFDKTHGPHLRSYVGSLLTDTSCMEYLKDGEDTQTPWYMSEDS